MSRPVLRGQSILDAIPRELHDAIARGDSTVDLADYFEAALRRWGSVYVPPGEYRVRRTITIGLDMALVGAGGKTRIVADDVAGPVIAVTGAPFVDGQQLIDGFRLSGKAKAGVHIDGGITMVMNNISLNGLVCDDGFIFENTFGSTYSNLWTNGATIANACFLVGQAFNANDCRNWYTSNRSIYGLYIDATLNGGTLPSHGSTWTSLCLQSTRYGLWMGSYQGATFNGTYMEDVAIPVRLGDVATGRLARAICFRGGDFQGPYHNHPHYRDRLAVFDFDYAIGCSIEGVDLSGAYDCGAAAPVIIEGDGKGAFAVARVCQRDGAWTIHSVEVLSSGTGYTQARAVVNGKGGAALRPLLAGGGISEIRVEAGGRDYAPTFCPIAIHYRKAFKCSLQSVMFNSGGSGASDASPLYPWIVRKENADRAAGITLSNDVTWQFSAYSGHASLVKTDEGAFAHAVLSADEKGRVRSRLYIPPPFP